MQKASTSIANFLILKAFVIFTSVILMTGVPINAHAASVMDSTVIKQSTGMYGGRIGGVRVDQTSPDCFWMSSTTGVPQDSFLVSYKTATTSTLTRASTGTPMLGLITLPAYAFAGQDYEESGDGNSVTATAGVCPYQNNKSFAPVATKQIQQIEEKGWGIAGDDPIVAVQVVGEVRCCPIVND